MAIRIVRSKLRKREEHSNTVHPADVVLQTPTPVQPNNQTCNPPPEPVAFRQQPLWQFPPPLPQPYVYANDQVWNFHLTIFSLCLNISITLDLLFFPFFFFKSLTHMVFLFKIIIWLK